LEHKKRRGKKKKINDKTEKSGGDQIMFYEEKFIHAMVYPLAANITGTEVDFYHLSAILVNSIIYVVFDAIA
jgi:hypothetical protein